jgi:hypothetical protein
MIPKMMTLDFFIVVYGFVLICKFEWPAAFGSGLGSASPGQGSKDLQVDQAVAVRDCTRDLGIPTLNPLDVVVDSISVRISEYRLSDYAAEACPSWCYWFYVQHGDG